MISKRHIIIAIIICLLVGLFYNLGTLEMRGEEPRRAIVSMEMIYSGDYSNPQLNGWPYYNKPPVFNWVMIGFMKLFGSYEEWVTRLPSLLSFLLIGGFSFLFTRKYVGKMVAVLSALFFLVSADLLFYGSVYTAEIDLFFSLTVYLQIMLIFTFHENRQYLWLFLLSYILVAIGTLTKGPPSIAFQGFTLIGMAIAYKDWRLLFSWQHVIGGGVFLLITGGYFYYYSLEGGDATGFIVRLYKEASMRTGLENTYIKTIKGIAEFPFLLFKILAPVSLLAVFFFGKGFITIIKSNPLIKFTAIFIVSNIWVYWFTGDLRIRYVYMFLPFLTLLLVYFYIERRAVYPRLTKIVETIFGTSMITVAVGFLVLPFLPRVSDLQGIWVVSIVFFAILIAISLAYFKIKAHRMLWLVLTLAVLRIGFDFLYHPMVVNDPDKLSYRKTMDDLFEITGGESFEFAGHEYVFKSDASIGPLKFGEVELTTAAVMSYQLPYYYSKQKNEPLNFTTQMEPGKYYLGYPNDLMNYEVKELYRFLDAIQVEVVLVKFLGDSSIGL